MHADTGVAINITARDFIHTVIHCVSGIKIVCRFVADNFPSSLTF